MLDNFLDFKILKSRYVAIITSY